MRKSKSLQEKRRSWPEFIFSSLNGNILAQVVKVNSNLKDIGGDIPAIMRFARMHIFIGGLSARPRKCRLRMQNFNEKHPHVIENVRCRCKICEGSIFKSQKKQDVDAIIHARQTEKHLQVQRRASCRYIGLKKSICNSEYQALQIQRLSQRYLQH